MPDVTVILNDRSKPGNGEQNFFLFGGDEYLFAVELLNGQTLTILM